MSELEIKEEKKSQNGLKYILRANLEGRLGQLHRQGDWGAFMDFYSRIRGPRRPGGHRRFSCQEGQRREPRDRIEMLYDFAVLMACDAFSKGRTTCPMEDYHWSWVKTIIGTMSKAEWTKHLDEATKKSISWYSRWNERDDMIIRCGEFPNVLVLGTQGAINYNPELLPR
ncbi:hypothetical protein CR513_33648, partial [Mucuna pruriens]